MSVLDSFSAMSTSSASAVPTTSSALTEISIGERKRVHNFQDLLAVANKYNIGNAAKSYLKNRGRRLIHTATPFMIKYGMVDGKFRVSWPNLANATRGIMCESLREVVPWLKCFEQDWGSDWIYTHLINQRVYDRNRKSRAFSDTDDDTSEGKIIQL